MTIDIFSTDDKTGVSADDKGALEALVGEGKKFKTVEELAKGKQESDAFIIQLEGESKTIRERVVELEGASDKQATVAELIAAVKAADKGSTEDKVTPMSEEDLAKQVKNIMQGETDAQTRASNRALANQSVLDMVKGDEEAAKSYLAERAKQLNLTVAGLTELGETSPKAFAALVTTDPTKTSSQASISSLDGKNTAALPTGDGVQIEGHNTKVYFDALKKEIGPQKFWNSSKIQGEMHKAKVALGERFSTLSK